MRFNAIGEKESLVVKLLLDRSPANYAFLCPLSIAADSLRYRARHQHEAGRGGRRRRNDVTCGLHHRAPKPHR